MDQRGPEFMTNVLDRVGATGKVIFQMVGGSHAYNLCRPDSDTDYIGIYIAPPQDIYALVKPKMVFDNRKILISSQLIEQGILMMKPKGMIIHCMN